METAAAVACYLKSPESKATRLPSCLVTKLFFSKVSSHSYPQSVHRHFMMAYFSHVC